ncbi:hypothetical protein [Altererythrobacter aquiaggeris]|uniref:hypothetical protein n=1 Tax=Aestuarierythrobacter aquiaggeris TaxID=1898396 RepID=UPI003017740A
METVLAVRDNAQFAALLVLAAWALWQGGGPERGVALTLLTMEFVDRINHLVFGAAAYLDRLDIGHAAIDAFACAAFVAIGLKANRMYTLWIAALQVIALNAHIVREFAEGVSPLAYAIMYIGPSYFQLLLLGLGIWHHVRRRNIFGNYRAWRNSPAQLAS